MSVSAARISLIVLCIAIAGCGEEVDPLQQQLQEDVRETDDGNYYRVREAFVATWDYLGTPAHATCLILVNPRDRYAGVRILPHEGGAVRIDRGDDDYAATEEWRRYCLTPANNAMGQPLHYVRGETT